jgi:hypothetical protein
MVVERMKILKVFKSIPWILILCLVLSAYAQNENLIKNPSVEFGSPDYWFSGGTGASWSNIGHYGIHSLSLNTVSQEGNWRCNVFNVSASGNFSFGFWVYGNCSSTFTVFVRFWSDYGGIQFISQIPFQILAGNYLDWKFINETSLKSPSNALTADIYITSNAGSGNLFFDDFSYVEPVAEQSSAFQWFHELFYGSAKWLTLIIMLAVIIAVSTVYPIGGILFLPITIFLGFDYFNNIPGSSDFLWGALMMLFASIYVLVMAIRKARSR